MEAREAQERAIKLTMGEKAGLNDERMDKEGMVHTCPNCGHEMTMDEVMGRAGGEKLADDDREIMDKKHMDKEGRVMRR